MPIGSTFAPTEGQRLSTKSTREASLPRKTRDTSSRRLIESISQAAPNKIDSLLPEVSLQKSSFSFLWTSVSADRQTRLASTLALLQEALNDAQKTDTDPWQFAVTEAELLDVGMRLTDLRWLVAVGVLDHAAEIRCRSGPKRVFRRVSSLAFAKGSCFVLSTTGMQFLNERPSMMAQTEEIAVLSGRDLPHWDGELRVLMIHGLVVKRFRTPASSQELILATFQEDGWPLRIDDPLRDCPIRVVGVRRMVHASTIVSQ